MIVDRPIRQSPPETGATTAAAPHQDQQETNHERPEPAHRRAHHQGARRIQGTCGVVPDRFERTANGVLTHVYNDEGTAIDWDTAEQANDNGSAVYIDENGDRVTGDEIELYHGAAEE